MRQNNEFTKSLFKSIAGKQRDVKFNMIACIDHSGLPSGNQPLPSNHQFMEYCLLLLRPLLSQHGNGMLVVFQSG